LGGDPEVVDKFTKALETNKIPVFDSPRRAIRAFKLLADRAVFLKDRRNKSNIG